MQPTDDSQIQQNTQPDAQAAAQDVPQAAAPQSNPVPPADAAAPDDNPQHMATPPRKRHRAGRIIGIILGVLLALVALVVIGINAYMRLTYARFYEYATPEFAIPGTNSGFIVQDMDVLPDGSYLFSGYASDGMASPLYRVAPDGATYKLIVATPSGSIYDGHGSGVTHVGQNVLLTQENGYLVLSLAQIMDATKDDSVMNATAEVQLGFSPAFLNVIDGDLYAGVFYLAGPYDTPEQMHLTTPSGQTNYAMMFAYEPDATSPSGFALKPAAAYSIPEKVQGVAELDDQMVFSQSWGAGASTFAVYDMDNLEPASTYTQDGTEVPLYFFDSQNLVGTVEAPPMAEGIMAIDGQIWYPNESASNKYIFGKLFGAWCVQSIDIQGYLAQ